MPPLSDWLETEKRYNTPARSHTISLNTTLKKFLPVLIFNGMGSTLPAPIEVTKINTNAHHKYKTHSKSRSEEETCPPFRALGQPCSPFSAKVQTPCSHCWGSSVKRFLGCLSPALCSSSGDSSRSSPSVGPPSSLPLWPAVPCWLPASHLDWQSEGQRKC